MDVYQPERKRRGRARERNSARQRRMAVPLNNTLLDDEKPITTRAPQDPGYLPEVVRRVHIAARDVAWYARSSRLILAGITVDEAAAALQAAWTNDVDIQIYDQDRHWSATPYQMGIILNARATAQAAQNVGLSGVPFGYGVLPVVSLDELNSQNYFLDLTEQSKILPYNAGYRWDGDRLVGVEGTDGRFLDIAATMTNL